jgi:putative ABC transport system permease protein
MIEGLLQDFRVAWRSLARTPGFTLVVIVVMALGIGANTMVFNIANAFLFRPLPWIDAQRNVLVWGRDVRHHRDHMEFSYANYDDLRRRATRFTTLGGYAEWSAYTTLGAEPERFVATLITPGFLSVFEARPRLGREFLPGEEVKARALTLVMVSERIWRERMGSDPRVIGRTLRVNGRVRTIVGVAPALFRFPETSDFFVPYPFDPAEEARDSRSLQVVGRLRPGVSIAVANAEVATIVADLAHRYPVENAGLAARVAPYREMVGQDMMAILALLSSAVAFVLLIACANVANLMLARGAGLRREIALRFALGATRAHIVRQRMAESVLLALAGGTLGLLLALWGRDLIVGSIPLELPFWMRFDTDPNLVLFMLGVSFLTALLAGLAPALQTSQVDVNEALKEGGAHGTAGRARSRLRSTLVVAEIALALVLLAGAGLMIRSFLHMTEEKTAVRSAGVLTAQLTMPIAVYPDADARRAFMDGLMPAVEGLPGVRDASAINILPLSHGSWTRSVTLEGEPTGPDAPVHVPYYAAARPGYFRTIGLARRAGRDFTLRDGKGAPLVAIVSETAARMFWPGRDPIGQRLKWGPEERDSSGFRTVVGVVADVRQTIRRPDVPAQVYVPHAQEPLQSVTLVLRHDGSPAALTSALRQLVHSRDADMPLYEVRTLDESIRQALWEQRIYAILMTVFALFALLIAGVGIYGVMAYSVAQRTQEIGIRMALGATRDQVIQLVVGQALRLTLIGVGLGLAGAYAVTRLMASLLFGVRAGDPPTFVGVTVLLALSSVLAAWVPAARATRVDPMVALRTE